MFWSPSRKFSPACTLVLELSDGSTDPHEITRISLENITGVEELEKAFQAQLQKQKSVVSVKLESAVPNGSLPEPLRGGALWNASIFQQWMQSITSITSNDDVESLFAEHRLQGFTCLKVLDLSSCNLSGLSGKDISVLHRLEYLNLSDNSLAILPKELGTMSNLKTLLCRSNSLTILPGELGKLRTLEVLDLSSNRLSSILISFSNLNRLTSLDVDDNPLESFPDLSGCQALTKLSFGSVSIEDVDGKVSVVCFFDRKQPSKTLVINFWGAPKESDPVQEFYDLALRGTTHHPLIIRGLAAMMESHEYKKSFLDNKQALEKVALMLLSEHEDVVTNACKVITILSMYDRATADRILCGHGDIILGLLGENGAEMGACKQRQLAGLRTIETITRFSSSNETLLDEKLINWALSGWKNHEGQVRGLFDEELFVTLLRVLGNLCSGERKRTLRDRPEFAQFLESIKFETSSSNAISLASKRLMSTLGIHGGARSNGSIRILSLDGGGMKGLSTVRLLRRIEQLTKRPLRDLFDLVVGTSTGALLTAAMMIKGMNLDECEAIYKEVGQKVFKHPVHSSENDESWANVFYRSLHMKTEHVRAVVVGCKHDTVTYEEILREKCSILPIGPYQVESMIDTSALDVPKIALVSALTSVSPVQPFIFRNYEYPVDSKVDRNRMGSSSHAMWEAVRASSAAMYYLDGFECGGKKYQDGALVANNPSLIALQEAHRIWPNEKIGFLLSVGVGTTPTSERQEGISSYIDTGSALLESATDVQEVHRALEVISSLIPGLNYERLAPCDERCDMELDCVDPASWQALEDAADEYIQKNDDIYQRIMNELSF
jgi:predicted acylesterase/phospholipase RssA